MTAAERIELRKKLTGLGRHELIRLLLAAWADLDATSGEEQSPAVQTEPALPAQAERGLAARDESPGGVLSEEALAAAFGDDG